jgi:hypothetical protein
MKIKNMKIFMTSRMMEEEKEDIQCIVTQVRKVKGSLRGP